MCLAIPGKIVKIKGDKAVIDYNGEKREANCSLIKVKEGDYVIVQAKFVMQIIPEKEALQSLEAWKLNNIS